MDSWGGEGLGSSVKPHLSKVKNEKVTAVQTDEEKHGNNDKASDSLDQILVKHVSRLEKEKMENARISK